MAKPNVKAYALDDNDQEAYRLREQHHIIKAAMGGQLVLAPLDLSKGGLRVLDSGTADGYWFYDLINDLPAGVEHAYVGTDISDKRFPRPADPRVQLELQSITEAWPAAWAGSFDLVHQRFVLAGCRTSPVQDAVEAVVALAKPGGWVQLVEPEQHAGPEDGPVMKRFVEMIQEVLRCTGMRDAYTPRLAGLLRGAGLQDVQERRFDLLLGASNPDPDLAAKGVRSTGIAVAFFVQLIRALPESMKTTLTDAELDSIVGDLEKELTERGGNYPFRVVWGRKPE